MTEENARGALSSAMTEAFNTPHDSRSGDLDRLQCTLMQDGQFVNYDSNRFLPRTSV